MKKQVFFFILFFFITSFSFSQENGTFIVSDGDKKITLILDTELPYVELDKPAVFVAYYENIDMKNCITISRGLKKLGRRCEGDCAVWQVTADQKGLVDGHLKVIFTERLSEDKVINLHILIPVMQ